VIGTLVVAAALLGFASPAAAQDPQPVTVGAGLTFFHFNDCCTEPGVRVEVAKVFRQMTNGAGLALVGELGWTSSEGDSTLTLAAGPRYVLAGTGSVQPFVHVLVGLTRYMFDGGFSSNNFSIGPGGGVAFPINDRVSGVGQIEFMIVKGDGFTDYGQRFTFGVIFELGQ
jgi:hypothetical protein